MEKLNLLRRFITISVCALTAVILSGIHTTATAQTETITIKKKDNSGVITVPINLLQNVTFYKSCPGVPTVTYEGKTYNTVQIGGQCWLKENLDVGNMIDSLENAADNGIIEKYCVRNNPANCATYGGLYQWDEAMQYVTSPGAKGICPVGWHIPTNAELEACSTAVGGSSNALKAVGQGTVWGTGTNTSGFSALLGGGRDYQGRGFVILGLTTNYWSSTEYSLTGAPGMHLAHFDDKIFVYTSVSKNYGFSIRCVKDN